MSAAKCAACLTQPPPLDSCLTAVSYEYPWSGIVHRFKFEGENSWALTLAQLMLAAPGVDTALGQVDVIIPMPLSRQRLRERGFNQCDLLSDALGRGCVRKRVLVRLLDAPPQSALPRAHRLRNVHSAYAMEPKHCDAVRGLRVALVDDVMTSGASLHAAATVLRRAGATHITGLVFARTENPATQ